ncbi:hypothetical protein [Pseudorhodobacter wandonensis]|uniref:hypothetical protein n=1 Tax=Pseudorhodobacter wandonensis TaxID=1120568 RepID=UPI000A44422C|nr:hypothetical protein [Pseudorhodobacter wandonensis]
MTNGSCQVAERVQSAPHALLSDTSNFAQPMLLYSKPISEMDHHTTEADWYF